MSDDVRATQGTRRGVTSLEPFVQASTMESVSACFAGLLWKASIGSADDRVANRTFHLSLKVQSDVLFPETQAINDAPILYIRSIP